MEYTRYIFHGGVAAPNVLFPLPQRCGGTVRHTALAATVTVRAAFSPPSRAVLLRSVPDGGLPWAS